MKTIRVRLADPGGGQVALWERHPDHPGGEVFLAGNGVFDVALTPAVESRLKSGKLVKAAVDAVDTVDKPKPEAPKPEMPEDAEQQPARAVDKKPPRAAEKRPRRGGL